MSQKVEHMPGSAPDSSKPYCLMNSDGTTAEWFATHDEAVSAMRKTTTASRMYGEDNDEFDFSLTPVRSFEFADDGGVWIEALEAKEYHTSKYGKVPITVTKLNNLAKSVKGNIRGIQLSTDYNHGVDAAKGSKASGTIQDAKVDGNKLLLSVAFTDTAKKEIKDGEWKYFSSDWLDTYTHEDGSKHNDVLLGGGLTNRPVAKGLNPLPVNFSELFNEVEITQNNEGGEMNEALKKLAEQLGIEFSEDTTEEQLGALVFAETEKLQDENIKLVEEVTPFRQLKTHSDKQKQFAEDYPEQAALLTTLRNDNISNSSKRFGEEIGARRFSETIVGEKDDEGNNKAIITTKGLSAKALDVIQETHKKFSEGTVTATDFENSIEAVFNNGIVDYGEAGTSLSEGEIDPKADDVPATGDVLNTRMAFMEKVTAIEQEKDERTFSEALTIAAEKFPKMYEAYMGSRS